MINDLSDKAKSIRKNIPSRTQSIVFRAKTALLQLNRGFQNLFAAKIKRFPLSSRSKDKDVIAESRTALWTESTPEERFLTAGKIHNLRLAVKKLDGVEVLANQTFSFWKHIGQANRLKGFVKGRELREGCFRISAAVCASFQMRCMMRLSKQSLKLSNASRIRKSFPVRLPKPGAMRRFSGIMWIYASGRRPDSVSKPT
jgi:hypothetical protein